LASQKSATSQFKSATSQFKSATSQCKSGMLQFKSATSRCSANSQLSFLQAKRRHVLVERVVNSSSSARKSSVLGTGLPLLSYVFACWSSSTWRCSAWQMKQSAVLAKQRSTARQSGAWQTRQSAALAKQRSTTRQSGAWQTRKSAVCVLASE